MISEISNPPAALDTSDPVEAAGAILNDTSLLRVYTNMSEGDDQADSFDEAINALTRAINKAKLNREFTSSVKGFIRQIQILVGTNNKVGEAYGRPGRTRGTIRNRSEAGSVSIEDEDKTKRIFGLAHNDEKPAIAINPNIPLSDQIEIYLTYCLDTQLIATLKAQKAPGTKSVYNLATKGYTSAQSGISIAVTGAKNRVKDSFYTAILKRLAHNISYALTFYDNIKEPLKRRTVARPGTPGDVKKMMSMVAISLSGLAGLRGVLGRNTQACLTPIYSLLKVRDQQTLDGFVQPYIDRANRRENVQPETGFLSPPEIPQPEDTDQYTLFEAIIKDILLEVDKKKNKTNKVKLTKRQLYGLMQEELKKNINEHRLKSELMDLLTSDDIDDVTMAIELLFPQIEEEMNRPISHIDRKKIMRLSMPVLKVYQEYIQKIDYLVQKIAGIQVNIDMVNGKGKLNFKGDGYCVTPKAGCKQKIYSKIRTKNTNDIFSKIMESGSINPLVAGVIFGSLLSSPPVTNSEFDHEVILEVDTKTLSTTIAEQLLGSSFFKASVVKQKDAFVFTATSLYFLE